jgi:hypothetical protein
MLWHALQETLDIQTLSGIHNMRVEEEDNIRADIALIRLKG